MQNRTRIEFQNSARLSPDGTVIRTYSRNEDGEWRHYVRQTGEFITLVKGAKDRVETVRRIYRRAFVDGWGLCRIARELNSRTVPAPRGGSWSRSTVRKILQNAVYRGVPVANKNQAGEYWKLGSDVAPIAVEANVLSLMAPDKTTSKESVWMRSHRPESEWVVFQCPELKNFLDEQLADYSEPCLTETLKKHVAEVQ